MKLCILGATPRGGHLGSFCRGSSKLVWVRQRTHSMVETCHSISCSLWSIIVLTDSHRGLFLMAWALRWQLVAAIHHHLPCVAQSSSATRWLGPVYQRGAMAGNVGPNLHLWYRSIGSRGRRHHHLVVILLIRVCQIVLILHRRAVTSHPLRIYRIIRLKILVKGSKYYKLLLTSSLCAALEMLLLSKWWWSCVDSIFKCTIIVH